MCALIVMGEEERGDDCVCICIGGWELSEGGRYIDNACA